MLSLIRSSILFVAPFTFWAANAHDENTAHNSQAKDIEFSVSNIETTNQTSTNIGQRRAFIDPVTGELTSTAPGLDTEPAQDGVVAPQLNATTDLAGPIKQMSDGSMMVELNGQFDKPLRATINKDGVLDIGHELPSGQPLEKEE